MSKNSNQLKNKKINWKKIGIILLIILAIISVIGIVFSVLAFTKNIKSNNSKDIGDQLQISYNVTLDNSENAKSAEEQMKDVSNSLYKQLKNDNINEFEIKYGISKQNDDKAPRYGTVIIELGVNDPGINFDPKLALQNFNSKDVKNNKTLAIQQQFDLFYRFANTYKVSLANVTKMMGNQAGSNVNFNGNSYLINKNENAFVNSDTNNIDLTLDKSTTNPTQYNGDWDLSLFQKQFVKTVNIEPVEPPPSEGNTSTTRSGLTYWDEADYDNEKAASAFLSGGAGGFTEAPEVSWLYWNDRSDLVYRLQLATLAAWLKNNCLGTWATKEFFLSENLIDSLSVYEQDFGYWLANNITTYAKYLNSEVININVANQTYDPSQDKLLLLLDAYYRYNKVSIPKPTDENKTVINEYKNKNFSNSEKYKFLYSWNILENPLIKKSFITIDYANFWKFFQSNNKKWMGDFSNRKDFNSKNYYSNTFTINIAETGAQLPLDAYVGLLNTAGFNGIFYNQDLTDSFDINFANGSNNKIATNLNNFADSLSIFEQQNLNSIISLPTYISAFIGILAIILIVGIVVSVLYRIPGCMAAITTTLSFTISCLLYSALGLSFSFGTYLLLAILAILAYIPIVYLLDYLKRGIQKGYNLNNSLKYSLRKYVKVTCGIYISLLIFGLVFLFFGYLQIQSFGTILIIASLIGVLFNGCMYILVLWGLTSCIEYKFNLLFNTKYAEALKIIKTTTFQSINLELDENNNNSIIEEICTNVDIRIKQKNWMMWLIVWLGLVSIVGIVLLFVLGPGFSLNYSVGTLIYLNSKNPLTNEYINQLIGKLNVSLFDIEINTTKTFVQTILIIDHPIDWNSINKLLENDGTILNYTIAQNETQTSLDLNTNVIECCLISFGFITIWSLLWLNIMNIIPVFLIQLINLFVIAGVVGLTRISYSIDSLISSLTMVVFFSTLTFGMFATLKTNFNFKKSYTKDELINYVVAETKWGFFKYNFAVISYFIANTIFMVFVSTVFLFSLVLVLISTVLLYFVNYYLVPTFFSLAMWLKKFFANDRYKIAISKYLHNINTGSQGKSKDFDKIDEQEIYGLNKFRIKENY